MAPIVLIFLLCAAVNADDWPQPRFLPPEVENNPGNVELKCDNSYNCKVTIDEAVKEMLYIAKLSYKGGASVTVNEVDKNDVKPEIKKVDEDLYIVTKTPQKYNTAGSSLISLYITIESVASDYLNLFVRDINNNNPILTMKDQVCPVEENSPGLTSCIIMLTDEDTVCDDFNVDLLVSGSSDVSNVFRLDVKPVEKCNKELTLVVEGDKGLDYETQRIYKLDINVTDGPNNAFERMVVDVVDKPDMPPVWNMNPTKNLVEETEYEMTLTASDGDVGLNMPLTYLIDVEEDFGGYFQLDSETGKLQISKINRDILSSNMFHVNATADDKTNQSSFAILFVVLDINDNSPTIVGDCNLMMKFKEGTIATLDNIIIKDMDEGKNGTFKVSLEDKPGKNFKKFFRVIPEEGYQNASFSITVTKPDSLDYETEGMKHFTFMLLAVEQADNSHVQRCEVTVELIDVNDEKPQFTNLKDQYVMENALDGDLITTLIATDKDKEDFLKYSTTSTSVHVDESSGKVTAIGGKFDYELQKEMIIQVKVQDTVNNSATGQFVLHIEDQNDTPPHIFLPFGGTNVMENCSVGYVVTEEIRAKDEDSSAELYFHIDWNGTYATQRGAIVDPNNFLETFAMNDSCGCNKGEYKSCSCLQINKPLDWSIMDTLYLNITVTDRNTEVNETNDSALLVIVIEDINNHEPVFKSPDELWVLENSTSGVKIGSVSAVDEKDGPGNNVVTYILEPINDTPSNLVTIDKKNGILTVDKNKLIDYETLQELYYSITAVDGDFHPNVNITINVKDINDNPPRITSKGNPDPIEELSDPGFVFQVESEDDDLTTPFNIPTYMFDDSQNAPVIRNLFHIDNATGNITTIDVLEYIKGSEYDIRVLVQDNFLNHDGSPSLTASTKITVKVLDVNNYPPEFQGPKDCEASPLETVKEDDVIVQVQATDRDENSENHDVLYSIVGIISVNAPKDPPPGLFTIDEMDGTIKAGMNLKGYIGNYSITVMGRNKDNIRPQNSTQSFTICVQDVNDHQPSIIFPTEGQIIQLKEKQILDDILIQYSGEKLPPITATDEDMGLNAMVDFSIYDKGAGPTNEYFYPSPIYGANSANLQLKKLFKIPGDREFEIVINATDRGELSVPTYRSIKIQVLSDGHPPYFTSNTTATEFKENDPGATFKIIHAKDYDNEYKGCSETFYNFKKLHAPAHSQRNPARISQYSCEEIIYSIVGGNDEGYFFIDNDVLRLNKVLDYESKPDDPDPKYVLTIAATNPGQKADPNTLELTVRIFNENDCPPKFTKTSYAEGIGVGDKPGKLIEKFEAIDPDGKGDKVTYELLQDTLTADDSLKSHMKDIYSSFDNSTGELTLNFYPDNTMHGYFSFQIAAVDTVGHKDTADVRVYIIADSNRHNFLFDNHKSFVDQNIGKIEEIFTKYIGYDCNVEKPTTEASGYVQELSQTSVIAHFIDSNESLPVQNGVTELLINEKAKEIKAEFKKYALYWVNSTPEDKSTDNGADQSALTQTVLIVVSALLATLVLLLLTTFFFKMRSYNRRLEALSQTKFGSQDSGLNRVNMNVPNTNQHALEGSNPVWNEELGNEDNISQGSGDSELVGVEDNPEFSPQNHRMEARRGSKNPIFDDIENEKEWSSVEYSPDINMNEEKNPNFSFGPPTTNVPTTEL